MGVNTVCLLRDREDFEETAAWLEGLGASLVLSEAEVRESNTHARTHARTLLCIAATRDVVQHVPGVC